MQGPFAESVGAERERKNCEPSATMLPSPLRGRKRTGQPPQDAHPDALNTAEGVVGFARVASACANKPKNQVQSQQPGRKNAGCGRDAPSFEPQAMAVEPTLQAPSTESVGGDMEGRMEGKNKPQTAATQETGERAKLERTQNTVPPSVRWLAHTKLTRPHTKPTLSIRLRTNFCWAN